MPKVSVFIPAYNHAQFIGEAIESVLAQTFTDFELIVVDDGSPDNTSEVVSRFTDPRLRLIRQSNLGISGAQNRGFLESRGTYVIGLDDDDIWLPGLLATQVAALDAHPEIGLVYARSEYMNVEGQRLGIIDGAPLKFPGDEIKSCLYGDHISGVTALIRRECIAQAGLWDESIGANQDWDMWVRLAFVCRFAFTDAVLAWKRAHTRNASGKVSQLYVPFIHGRLRVLNNAYARANLPPQALEVKPLAYRNAYIFMAERWLLIGHWREALKCYLSAIQISTNPLDTLSRILVHGLYENWLRRIPIFEILVHKLAKFRRHGHTS